MQPVFQKIEANINFSFYVEQVKFPYFSNPLQFHPEIEILLVIDGRGTLFVGDSISSFGPGDLVMIGQNVPHVWFSNEKYTFENNNRNSEIIFILFKMEIFGEQFWHLPESKSIHKFITPTETLTSRISYTLIICFLIATCPPVRPAGNSQSASWRIIHL